MARILGGLDCERAFKAWRPLEGLEAEFVAEVLLSALLKGCCLAAGLDAGGLTLDSFVAEDGLSFGVGGSPNQLKAIFTKLLRNKMVISFLKFSIDLLSTIPLRASD